MSPTPTAHHAEIDVSRRWRLLFSCQHGRWSRMVSVIVLHHPRMQFRLTPCVGSVAVKHGLEMPKKCEFAFRKVVGMVSWETFGSAKSAFAGYRPHSRPYYSLLVHSFYRMAARVIAAALIAVAAGQEPLSLDDECTGEEQCALNALQRRGEAVSLEKTAEATGAPKCA
eukprot:s959_g7.t1